ncbi:MAG: hypothetical protein ACJ8FK_12120, partial [Xanthobacteraceae bacterium]
AACAGLLPTTAAWGEGSGPGAAHEVRLDKGETLSDLAWQHGRDQGVPAPSPSMLSPPAP